MSWSKEQILNILDECAKSFTFPVLDNGYVYLAATKLSIYRSDTDWALVIEVFGFSPRSGTPDVQIYTFSSNLYNRNGLSDYVSETAHENYLKNNPYNESRFVHPIENEEWMDSEISEYLNESATCVLRGAGISLPEPSEYSKFGIELEEDSALTYEFCRYLASRYREQVLCTEEERRVSVSPELKLMIQLDEWHHPDISDDELPSGTKTFQQLAEVIERGSLEAYKNDEPKNTHWVNWPESGTL